MLGAGLKSSTEELTEEEEKAAAEVDIGVDTDGVDAAEKSPGKEEGGKPRLSKSKPLFSKLSISTPCMLPPSEPPLVDVAMARAAIRVVGVIGIGILDRMRGMLLWSESL